MSNRSSNHQLSRLAGDISHCLLSIDKRTNVHETLTEVREELLKLAASPSETSTKRPTYRQIIFNWMMDEPDFATNLDGYWGGAEQVAKADELIAALGLPARDSPEEPPAECDHPRSELLASKGDQFEMRKCLECTKIFRVRLREKAAESPDPFYCSACGQEDRDCYCDPSTPPLNGT